MAPTEAEVLQFREIPAPHLNDKWTHLTTMSSTPLTFDRQTHHRSVNSTCHQNKVKMNTELKTKLNSESTAKNNNDKLKNKKRTVAVVLNRREDL